MLGILFTKNLQGLNCVSIDLNLEREDFIVAKIISLYWNITCNWNLIAMWSLKKYMKNYLKSSNITKQKILKSWIHDDYSKQNLVSSTNNLAWFKIFLITIRIKNIKFDQILNIHKRFWTKYWNICSMWCMIISNMLNKVKHNHWQFLLIIM